MSSFSEANWLADLGYGSGSAFEPGTFSRKKAQKNASIQGTGEVRSEDRLLTPARPRYLLTPDSFFPLRLGRASSSVLPALAGQLRFYVRKIVLKIRVAQ